MSNTYLVYLGRGKRPVAGGYLTPALLTVIEYWTERGHAVRIERD